MNKVKVGDLVLISAPADGNCAPGWCDREMYYLDGAERVVSGRDEHGWLLVHGEPYSFSDEWVSLVERRVDDPTTLTRRDHFAMAALTGLCANCDSTGMFAWTPESVTDFASRIADLMEAARNKEGAE